MSLAGTEHMRAAVVIARDDAGTEYAIRGLHGGSVIDLTLQEAHWVQQLRLHGVQGVLQAQFGSMTAASDLQKLVDLILRLHENGLLEKIVHEELMNSVETLARQASKEPVSAHSRHRRGMSTRAPLARLGSVVASDDWFPVVTGAILGGLMLLAGQGETISLATALSLLETPAATLTKLWFGILAVSTIQSFIVGWITWAASPEPIREEPRLTITVRAWLFLVATHPSEPIDMLSRRAEIRVRLVALMVPWIGFYLAALVAGAVNSQSLLVVAFSFALSGLAELNPSDRRHLVALMEAWTREPDVLAKTLRFLKRGLLRFDQKASLGQGILASLMMLWLTGLTILTAELLNSSIMSLGVKAAELEVLSPMASGGAELANQLASIGWLVVMATIVVGGLLKMVAIPFQNFASLASLPLKQFRPETLVRLDRAFNPESFRGVIAKLPVMAFASDQAIHAIAKNPSFSKVLKGQTLQSHGTMIGDNGILVVIAGQLHDSSQGLTYTAGDCLPAGATGAPLTATSKCVLLEIREDTVQQALAAQGANTPTKDLAELLRAIKLLQESAALSYLTPKQTLSIAATGTFRSYTAGTTVIREGDESTNAAFLIESGSVEVRISANTVAESIGRGGLVGSTALLRNSVRTATVLAKSDTTCFEIARNAFISASSTNAVVAILLGTITSQHQKINDSVGKRGAA